MSVGKTKDRLAVYVDGFNLYHGLHAAAGRELLWLDLIKLAKVLRPRSSLVRVKYFTAMVRNDPEGQSRQDRYIEAMKAHHPGSFTVIMGQYMEKPRRCRDCGATWTSYEEKQTDVNMAVHLVADVAADIADTYLLITADTDVIPAVKMARAQRPSATIIAQFPPRRESSAIRRLLPSSRQITLTKIREAQFPDLAKAPNGQIFRRPQKWVADGGSSTEKDCAVTGPQGQDSAATCDHPVPRPTPGTVAKMIAPQIPYQ